MLRLEPGEIFANNYRLVRLIDTGGFADVWEAVFLSAGNTVALKIYPKLDVDGVKNIEDEYRNQADLSHSHLLIARYFGKDNGYPFLEMKYCGGGNASANLGSNNEHEAVKALNHVASALEYLHENDTVHQDIKPTNFLIDKNGSYYLADLGLSLKIRKTIARYTQKAQATSAMSLNGITPPPYRAPELYDRTNVGTDPIKATDVWALGASIFEMITGDTPFGELGGINQVNGGEMPPLGDEYSKDLAFILESCLKKNTWERPKASDLVKWTHNYLYGNNYGLITADAPVKTIEIKTGNIGKETVVNNKGKETMVTPAAEAEKQHKGHDKGQGTNKDGHIPNDVEKAKGPDTTKIVMWVILSLAAVAIAVFGIKYYAGKNERIVAASDSLVKKDSVVKTGVTKINPAAIKPDSGKKDSSKQKIVTAPNIVAPVNTDAPVITPHPEVNSPPRDSKISIRKVERTAKYLKIYFTLRKPSTENYTFTIYGPESPANCLFLNVDGTSYNLTRISPSGQGLTFGSSNTFDFAATFRPIPASVHLVDAIEGLDRDRSDQNYWTFKGIHIK